MTGLFLKWISFFQYIFSTKKDIIFNLYNTNFKKRVLIIYLTHPFICKRMDHANIQESLTIADIFHKKGFVVDVVNCTSDFNKNNFKYKKYECIFGLEPNFVKLVKMHKPKKTIYYATGSHYAFQNIAEKNRIADLNKRKGVKLVARRFVKPHSSYDIADAIICIGNKQTSDTYVKERKQIELVRVSASPSYYNYNLIKKNKQFNKVKQNFLWFGSSGAVHKGLDILLDIFKENLNINLYIAGDINKEKDFIKLYYKELFKTLNIKYLGFIFPNSKKFRDLVLKCTFVIMPSCSEGMNGSVVTCMRAGLIPVVSKESGLDVEDCGIILEDNNIDTIKKMIKKSLTLSVEEIIEKSECSFMHVIDNHNIDTFRKDFDKALEKIL